MPSKTHYPPAPGFVSFTVDGFIVDTNDLTAAPRRRRSPRASCACSLKATCLVGFLEFPHFSGQRRADLSPRGTLVPQFVREGVKARPPSSASIWAERDLERERLKRQAQQPGYKLVPIEENQPSNPFIPKHRGTSSLKATCPSARGHTGEELLDWFAVGGADPWRTSSSAADPLVGLHLAERDLERQARPT